MNRPYSEATVELVAEATEQHHIVAGETDAMGNNPCVCGQWWDAAGDNPGWDQHMAEVALDALAAAGLLLPEGAETRTEREQLALHLDILAKRLRGFGVEAQRPAQALAEQLRADALPIVVIDEPGPDVQVVMDPLGNKVRRGRGRSGGWVWWGGRSGNRPEWSWEKVRDGFGPLVLPPPEDS